MELDMSHLQYMVEHVFLPPRLPQSHDAETEQKDGTLYKFVAHSSQLFLKALVDSEHAPSRHDLQCWERLVNMLNIMASIHQEHQLSREDIKSALRRMRPGDVLPLHIAAQNAGVILRKVDPEHLTFEAFELSLRTDTINEAVGKIIQRFPSNPRLPIIIDTSVISTLANVLSYLSNTTLEDAIPTTGKGGSDHHETRQSVSPRYITEALAGCIRGYHPELTIKANTPYIYKRINDHALWKNTLLPWRRTPSLLLIKVALQSTLSEIRIDNAHGYKSFWTFTMSLILEAALKGNTQHFTIDLLRCMNVRLARRLAKLGPPVEGDNVLPLKIASRTVHLTAEILEIRWKRIQAQFTTKVQWNEMKSVPREGWLMRFPHNQDYLGKVMRRKQILEGISTEYDNAATIARIVKSCAPRTTSIYNLPANISTQEVDIALFDFETWVADHLPRWSQSPSRSKADLLPLSSIMTRYADTATVQYKDDPERLSLMYLCILELWVSLDEIVCQWCPLLAEFSPEIPEDFLDPLLLPKFKQMKRLHSVQLYLQRRHLEARNHGLRSVFGDINSPHSFANRFFKTSHAFSLINLQHRIQQWSNSQKQKKLQEMNQKNATYRSLMNQAAAMSCNNTLHVAKKSKAQVLSHMPGSCKRCKVQKQAKKPTIQPFEEPLPEGESQRQAIVFELECPLPIALWRDQTISILVSARPPKHNPSVQWYPLDSFHPLINFFKSPLEGKCLPIIGIASSTKSLNKSHYGAKKPLPATSEQLLKKHTGTYSLCNRSAKGWLHPLPEANLRPRCALPMYGPYQTMQPYTSSTTHLPNEVLSSIHCCPTYLPTTEYVAFCQLRSGNRIQWRNIMRAIRTQSLTFSEPSVANLVLQSIWQAESMGDKGVYRDAHYDLQDHGFGIDAAQELLSVVQHLGSNWKQHLYISIIVALATRLLELSPHVDVQVKALLVIHASRALLRSWISAISGQSELLTEDSHSSMYIRQSIATIAIVFRSTFDIDSNPFTTLDDTTWFIYAGILAGSENSSPSKTSPLTPHRDRRIALRLESSLAEKCKSNPSILHKAVALAWKAYRPGTSWLQLPSPGNRWWTALTKKGNGYVHRAVHLNILDGALLIDGKLSDRLPAEYTTQAIYSELFGDHVFLEVHPSTMKGMTYQVDYHKSELHFGLIDQELLIRKRLENTVEEYISATNLSSDLPIALITNHHYWYGESTGKIELQSETRAWNSNLSGHWTIQLDRSRGQIYGKVLRTTRSGESTLLDPNSRLYRSLARALLPLESRERGLVVTKDPQCTPGVTIYIPGQDIAFELNRDGQLECQSLPGYVVNQTCNGVGCLFGLQTFLCLRPGDHREQNGRKILVPRGTFSSCPGLYGHPVITIERGEHGGYFVYDVDDLVGRLVGNRTMESDLYLVKLHAFTASPLPDPLTQCSGTEEALNHLQEASCFSALNISPESRRYLEDIANLTPLRAAYPPHLDRFTMETVDWNITLPAGSQHSSFRTRVEHILVHWQNMLIFHGQTEEVRDLDAPKGMAHFNSRAALRSRPYSMAAETAYQMQDLLYKGRDSLTSLDSQERERKAFQPANFTKQSSSSFPICRDLSATALKWNNIQGDHRWHWNDVHQWLRTPHIPDISELWCTLFELCRKTAWPPPFEASVTLGMLGFSGVPIGVLASLAAVIHNPAFQSKMYACPQLDTITLGQGSTFNREAIRGLLHTCAVPITSSTEYGMKRQTGETDQQRLQRITASYNSALEEELDERVGELERHWASSVHKSDLAKIASWMTKKRLLPLPSSSKLREIQQWMTISLQNRIFLHHLALVQGAIDPYSMTLAIPAFYAPIYPKPLLHTMYDGLNTFPLLMSCQREPRTENPNSHAPLKAASPNVREPVPELEALLSRLRAWANTPFEQGYLQHLQKSIEALNTPQLHSSTSAYFIEKLASLREDSWKIARRTFDSIKQALSASDNISRIVQAAGMWPAITPHALLRLLSIKQRRHIPDAWLSVLIHYAICLHSAKRYDIILKNAHIGRTDQLAMEKFYHRHWDVAAHVDWILFEIDTGMTVRENQADLALEMISPQSGKNSVMQLNMGEGKSSVIVPIVAATLSSYGNVLPRVIVPRAQTKQQFQFLRRALTSLCDRSIVYLPFNRQLGFTAESVTKVHTFLRGLANTGGIWLCEPEQLLSLKLLGLDKLLRASAGIDNGGSELLNLQLWLNTHSQDIIDESDEVLQTRQQVIYTVGTQRNMDASPRRWEIIQRLLHLLGSYLLKRTRSGQDVSGVYVETSEDNIAGFPQIRIQSDRGRLHLEHFIQTTFEEKEWSLPQSLKVSAIDFIVSVSPAAESLRSIEAYCAEDQQLKHMLLVLRGMISHDILLHGLKDKRWRVEYGLDLARSGLAIPFRAKDFPSPRSEFAHPDLTLLLTCLSYYYAGLDDEMVRRSVKDLLRSATPDLTYADWIRPCLQKVPKELQTIRGINMDDSQLLTAKLFPLLRYNKVVVDYYLNSFVFPTQAKEFPYKLLSSGWDLAAEKTHVTTGFSGTNDSRILLPTPITQVDRPAQLHTNAKVLSRLLLEENKTVIQYPDHYKSMKILDRICELWNPPTVILDVGAQILDSTNLEFSRSWLARYDEDSGINAVVFFDDGGNLSVLTRDDSTVPFLDSPYASNLERCLVYLDEAHTRGTDLRLPPSQAVVTLGPRLTKDKLVQGCMRMRRLGDVHKLLFIASEEVVRLIVDAVGCLAANITSMEVVLWTMRESWRQAQADLPAWVQQGKSFMKREMAWQDLLDYKPQIDPLRKKKKRKSLEQQSVSTWNGRIQTNFCETEAKTLDALYEISNDLERDLVRGVDTTHEIGRLIVERCEKFGSFPIYDTTILEEMEVELMHEKEMEREVEVIPSSKPAMHAIHPDVLRFIDTGFLPVWTSGLLHISEAFANLSLRIPAGIDQVFSNMRVTQDFCNTVILQGPGNRDHFLRPVEWVVTNAGPVTTSVVAFSPYEVNELLPQLRTSKAVRLHIFAPRGNLFMQPFGDLDRFVLPSNPLTTPLPRALALQLDLFSGSLYLRDYEAYKDMCSTLRLHFDDLPPHLAKPEIINLSCYVKDPSARLELGMSEAGFSSNPLPFFRKLLVLRRYGQKLGPSHMGRILYGSALHKGKDRDFDE